MNLNHFRFRRLRHFASTFYRAKIAIPSVRRALVPHSALLGCTGLVLGLSTLGTSCLQRKPYYASCTSLEKVKLCKVSDLRDGEAIEVKVHDGKDIVLVSKVKGKYYCTANTCPHFGAPLVNGGRTDHFLICPWHNAKFNFCDGECVNGPFYDSLPTYNVVIDNDDVYAHLPPYPLEEHVPPKKKKSVSGTKEKVFVICGGGAAAHSAAETLRNEGFTGRILIYGDEKHLPYYRPHLTKKIESIPYDEVAVQQALRPQSFYDENKIEYYGGKRVVEVDDGAHLVKLDDGTTVKYDKVLVATGSESNRLPFSKNLTAKNHFTIRTIDDLKGLSNFVKSNAKIVIIGANFIGCEIASALLNRKADVTVITDTGVPLENIVGKRVGGVFEKLMQDNKVKFIPNAKVKGYKTSGDSITQVLLEDQAVKADVVIEGVGARVNVDFLKCAKKQGDGTVKVDSNFRCTGCKDVFAAGDVVTYPYHLNGDDVSIKHWNVAIAHGKVAAKNMLGQNAKMTMVPFFWTSFFKKGMRYAGVSNGADSVIYEGNVDACDFVAYYFKDRRPVALMSMGKSKVGAILADALDNNCVPSLASLKMGAANSDTMLRCMEKLCCT